MKPLRVGVGVAEYWQGSQANYSIMDCVRVTNEYGDCGFFADPRRLNVLLSRMRMALTIIGDRGYVGLSDRAGQNQKPWTSWMKSWGKTTSGFRWLMDNGRMVEVARHSISSEFVKLDVAVADGVAGAGLGW